MGGFRGWQRHDFTMPAACLASRSIIQIFAENGGKSVQALAPGG
jgi:hypothetical protein